MYFGSMAAIFIRNAGEFQNDGSIFPVSKYICILLCFDYYVVGVCA